MKLSKIYIKNFRSIKELTVEPNELCSIIGPNSCGKTNVLKALDLLLGEGWTTKAKVAKELFNDVSKPIEISVDFDQTIKFISAKGYPKSVSNIALKMVLKPELYVKTTINNGCVFYDQEMFKKVCHFIYIPSERFLESELRVSQWTMLGKLMKLIYENYLTHYKNDEEKLKKDFEVEMETAKNFLEKDFSDEADVLTFNKFSSTFKRYCRQNSAGLACDFEPILNIYNMNWFYKTLQIHVKEDFLDKPFDSEEVGSGMQNLLMLSIFQTYAELMGRKVIFGIEEPEIYLYPQAQRSLYKNFIKISKDTQIFYTTHNPNFVDAFRPDDILLLRKDKEKGTYKLDKDTFFSTETAKKFQYKIYTHFNPERNEIFFAKKVILVEGDSDKILFSTLFTDKWKVDLDIKGVSIISCGGKSGVNYFIGICKLIGFQDYFAVWDSDDDDYSPDRDFLKDTLQAKKGIEIPDNLENFLGLPKGENVDKVKNAYRWASEIEVTDIPEDFLKVEAFVKDKVEICDKNKKDSESEALAAPPPPPASGEKAYDRGSAQVI